MSTFDFSLISVTGLQTKIRLKTKAVVGTGSFVGSLVLVVEGTFYFIDPHQSQPTAPSADAP